MKTPNDPTTIPDRLITPIYEGIVKPTVSELAENAERNIRAIPQAIDNFKVDTGGNIIRDLERITGQPYPGRQ